ncbi:hypothetical protein THTE_2235 [Thermogutta terrifontis]|uniref:Uncharacterized protein n=1 Tax=Thermogutta terrifontis TaxID=1331910 RepID=A0A286RFV9_9BACT|nr:hypothetical protein THTE_2235 [Thermogutta terrifontis]
MAAFGAVPPFCPKKPGAGPSPVQPPKLIRELSLPTPM